MQWKAIGVISTLVAFAGCGASPDEAQPTEDVAVVSSAATGCTSYTATVQDHLIAGRVNRTDSQFLFWTFTTYYTAGLASETIGSLPTQVVTLYPKASGYTLNAALCQVSTCGNGVLEAPSEQCDGNQYFSNDYNNPNVSSYNCSAFGADPPWASGDVSCSADCKYEFSTCKTSVCGDGIVNGDEQCDGQNIGLTCQQDSDQGVFTGGTLKCSSTCKLDPSGCTSLCGNGVLDAGEDCDGTLLTTTYGGKTCSDFQVPYPTWPFGIRVPYSPGSLHCDKFCKMNLPSLCTVPLGCYFVFVAGGQPATGVRCF